jgi:hypothetical protein
MFQIMSCYNFCQVELLFFAVKVLVTLTLLSYKGNRPWLHGSRSQAPKHGAMARGAMLQSMAPSVRALCGMAPYAGALSKLGAVSRRMAPSVSACDGEFAAEKMSKDLGSIQGGAMLQTMAPPPMAPCFCA